MMKLFVTAVVSLIASSSFAAATLGSYQGVTASGESCALTLAKENKTYVVQMSYALEGQNKGCGFHARNRTEGAHKLRVGGGSDDSVCKVSVVLANDGTPVSAEMGIGSHLQIGSDADCMNLQRIE